MECERPLHIKVVDDFYRDGFRYVTVGCRKCPACQANRRKQWFFRLKLEEKYCLVSFCATLTYDDLNLPDLSGDFHPINYDDVQKLHKKLRKKYDFRFFAVCEYGAERLRPHYHILYFFDDNICYLDFLDDLYRNWFDGTCRISLDVTTDRAAEYCLKYCLSSTDEKVDDKYRPLIRCSNRPYIGYRWLDQPGVLSYLHDHGLTYSRILGYPSALPRLLKQKIFDDDERRTISLLTQYDMVDSKILQNDYEFDRMIQTGEECMLHDMQRQQYNLLHNKSVKQRTLK